MKPRAVTLRLTPNKGTFYARTLLPIDIRIYDAVDVQRLELTLQFAPHYMRVAVDDAGRPRLQVTKFMAGVGKWRQRLQQPEDGKKTDQIKATFKLRLQPFEGGKRAASGSGRLATVRFMPRASTLADPESKRGRRSTTPIQLVRCSAVDVRGNKLEVVVENGAYNLMANRPKRRVKPHIGSKGWRKDHSDRADRDIEIIRYIHEMKFLTRDLIRRLWFQTPAKPGGSAGMAYKRLKVLEDWQYIERYRHPKTDYAKPYLLGDRGWQYLKDEGLTWDLERKDTLNTQAIEHDLEITELRRHFEENEKIRQSQGHTPILHGWLSERRVRKMWQSEDDKLDESRRFFAPDGLMFWGPKRAKVAVELERQIKDHARCRIIFEKYEELIRDGWVDWILVIVEDRKDRDRFFEKTLPGVLKTEAVKPAIDYFKVVVLEDVLRGDPFDTMARWAFPVLKETPARSRTTGRLIKGVAPKVTLEKNDHYTPLHEISDFLSWQGTTVGERHEDRQRKRDFETLYVPKNIDDWLDVAIAMEEDDDPDDSLRRQIRSGDVFSIEAGTPVNVHGSPKQVVIEEGGEDVIYELYDVEPTEGESMYERGWAEKKFVRKMPLGKGFEIARPKGW